MNKEIYVSIAQMANCKICKKYQDLRAGVCFQCLDKVSGKKISDFSHKLWETINPNNFWYYSENHN